MREKTALFACLVTLTGLVFSKFLITMGMLLLIVAALASNDWKIDLGRFRANKAYWATIGIFFIILLSGIYTENWQHLWPMLRVALPFLLLPLAFGLLPPIKIEHFKGMLYFLLLLMSGAALWVLVNYLMNYEYYQLNLAISKVIATPQKDHIRFSLLLCLSIFSGAWLLKEGFIFRYRAEKILIAVLLIFLLVMLHVLSVRSGLLAFYAGIFVYGIRLIVVQRRWILGGAFFLFFISAPFIAFYTLPSFQQKYYLMKYNWNQFQQGKIGNLSDTQRLLSYQIALRVAAQNPWIGVGIGDLYEEQEKIYKEEYPELGPMQPHNQLLSFYAGTGILGLLAFLFCFFLPFFYRKAYRSGWLLLFLTIIFSSFLTENTIFIAIGTGIHCFFLLLFLNVQDGLRLEKNSC